jgi:hypothetical protein
MRAGTDLWVRIDLIEPIERRFVLFHRMLAQQNRIWIVCLDRFGSARGPFSG